MMMTWMGAGDGWIRVWLAAWRTSSSPIAVHILSGPARLHATFDLGASRPQWLCSLNQAKPSTTLCKHHPQQQQQLTIFFQGRPVRGWPSAMADRSTASR